MDINSFAMHFPSGLTEKILMMGTKDLQEIRITAQKNVVVQKNGMLMELQMKISSQELLKIVEGLKEGETLPLTGDEYKAYLFVAAARVTSTA